MTIDTFNKIGEKSAKKELMACCQCARWAESVAGFRPYKDVEELLSAAEDFWYNCGEDDWLEAFKGHPEIGDLKSLEKKFAASKEKFGNEQSEIESASKDVLKKLAKGNEDYQDRFGFIFIVCASGKSAKEMLSLLQSRLPNNREEELEIAMGEQNKITKLRLQKLIQ